MTQRSPFLEALHCRNFSSRPPVWIMRQAGRYMPEYRAIRGKYSFLEMVKTPELAAKITNLPIQRFGFDAAILFSDILTITESLGFPVRFEEGIGPVYDTPLKMDTPLESLRPVRPIEEVCSYVADAIKLTKSHLNVPLIGFCGAPFTVASYMIEGQSSRDLKKTKQWIYRHPSSFLKLLDIIADATIEYLEMQIRAGVDAIQIFDSWTNVLTESQFVLFASHIHAKIINKLNHHSIPIILFCRGSGPFAHHLAKAKPHALGFDWTCSLKGIRSQLPPGIALQGNLDPCALFGTKENLIKQVNVLLNEMEGDPGYIFNLGHGILPDVSPNAVETLMEIIKSR
ncbi:MAG: uroporphyrinogen decarboxylase [Chlamydiales bacterium]